jgi:hypothetical protein
MKEYKFSSTNNMLKQVEGFGSFGNSLIVYAVSQASENYKNTMIKDIKYEFLPDEAKEDGGTHQWTMTMCTPEEFFK